MQGSRKKGEATAKNPRHFKLRSRHNIECNVILRFIVFYYVL